MANETKQQAGQAAGSCSGEEEKTEFEPLKILGKIENKEFVDFKDLQISAHCNRVAVIDGHLACVSVLFGDKKPSKEEILEIWKNFKAEPQELDLPFAPQPPIIYKEEENRPQVFTPFAQNVRRRTASRHSG